MDTSLTQHVERASEAIRAANHASLGPVTGPDAYLVVGSLAELVHRVPQLLDFLSGGLRRVDPAELYDDRGTDPAGALGGAHGHLLGARALVEDLADQLDHAHIHLGHLGHHLPKD